MRVRIPGGIVGPRGLRAVAAVAARGNGIVELTSRAALQVRGLGADDAPVVAGVLRRGGLLPSPAHDRVRNVVAPVSGGRLAASLRPTDDVVVALDAGLCADPGLAALPGRMLFAVEDGTGVPGGLRADVALVPDGDGAGWRLCVDGVPTTLTCGPRAGTAAGLALDAARAFLALLQEGDEPGWRVADLPDGAARVAARLGGALRAGGVPEPPSSAEPGRVTQADGRVAVTAVVPLGRLDAVTLNGLAALLDDLGHGATARVSVARTVTVVDVPAGRAEAIAAALGALRLVTTPDSGWDGLTACAGLGACAKARVDVRGAAASRVPARRGRRAAAEHWAACERGCGRPASERATVLRAVDGTIDVERDGAAVRVAGVDAALALLADGGRA